MQGRGGDTGRYKKPARPHLGMTSQGYKGGAAGVKNEMRVSEPLWAQNMLAFCSFILYTNTHTEIVPLQSSVDSDSKILKPEGTIRSSLLTFCITQIIKYHAESVALSQITSVES